MSESETPFNVSVSDSQLLLLRQKLDLTTYPDELEDAGWKYGAPLSDIQRLVAYWKDGFDWRKQEVLLNEELPQFTREIPVENHGTLKIHYVHKKSTVVDAIPLLFVHGWPGSFLEVHKILPLFIKSDKPEHPSFHVVAISLPGFGFSDAPKKPGFGMAQHAEVCNKLMLALGYDKYVTQGGDWGQAVTRQIAGDYGGKHSMAWHTNFPRADPPTLLAHPFAYLRYLLTPYTAADKAGIERMNSFRQSGMGYLMEQSTQPQTLGYSLADSPAGLLAWIYEKLVNWTDNYPWTDDEVLTWISIYWFSKAGPAASVRIYYEFVHTDQSGRLQKRPTIPVGISRFPQELRHAPKTWRVNVGNVIFSSEHSGGGHFAAHEKPQELVDDLRKMFGKGGPAFAVVPGKTGY